MNKLRGIALPPRFTQSDLTGWTDRDLTRLMTSSHLVESGEKVKTFREGKLILEGLRPTEIAVVLALKNKQAMKALTSIQDVHGHFLNTSDCHYSEAGLHAVEKIGTGDPQQIVIPPMLWMAPEELVPKVIGLEWIVGLCLTCLQREDGKVVPFYHEQSYQKLAISSLNAPEMGTFASTAAVLLAAFFKGQPNKGNGRAFIAEMYSAVSSLPKDEYIMLHVAATEGPLNRCFRWGEIRERLIPDQSQSQARPRVPPRKDIVIVPVTAKLPDKKKYYNMGVVPAYADSFVDMAASTSGKAYLETDKCGAILPLWVAAIPTDAQMPEQKDMASAAAFMALCRSQRQTDEKGLSAWSCGYGATGNPTKPQLRMQKKLSMVLGILQSMDTRQILVIFDDLPQELPMLHAQLMLWVTRNSVFQDKRWKYFVSSSASKIISALPDHCVTQTNFIGRYQLLYFPNTFVELPRYSEWSKVDVSQISSLQSLVHPYFPMKRSDISDGETSQTATSTQTVTVPELSKVVHVHVYTRLFSKRVFDFF